MSPQHVRQCSRRRFLSGLALTGTVGLLGLPPRQVAAEPSPETTRLRLAQTTSICQAPQYIAHALFEAEGFTDVQFVGEAATADRTLVSGDAQLGMLFLGPFLLRLAEGAPLLILSGGHVSCLELFAHEPIRSVRDLRGRSVAVVALGTAGHVFLATIMAKEQTSARSSRSALPARLCTRVWRSTMTMRSKPCKISPMGSGASMSLRTRSAFTRCASRKSA